MKSRRSRVWTAAPVTVLLLFLTGPGFNFWPLAFIALAPLVNLARSSITGGRVAVYGSFFVYYLVSLQGLRYAHPLMLFPLLAMAAYLAIYPLLFFVMLRRWFHSSAQNNDLAAKACCAGIWMPLAYVPFVLIAAVLWVGGEWVRNYFATGISVLMLGHSLTAMPSATMIQIADLCGTYGVSFLLVLTSVAVADAWQWFAQRRTEAHEEKLAAKCVQIGKAWQTSVPIAVLAVAASYTYGASSLRFETIASNTTLMLIGRDEQTEYQQDLAREQEIFSAFARQTIAAVSASTQPIAAVVWPESMLSGGQPWYIAEADLEVPAELAQGGQGRRLTVDQLRQIITESQDDFVGRNENLQAAMSHGTPFPPPAIVGGCGIVKYGPTAKQFSGIVLVDPDGQVRSTYAKNHLVMFGEYIPLIKSIPGLKEFVPAGLGLDAGTDPAVFEIGTLRALPNLCIETAVERISVNHMRAILDRDPNLLPQVILTLTNDAWFDNSAVIEHHLRCAQMVAIGCRRPILSAANGGPTAWIDSSGRIVEQLPAGTAGEIVAQPEIDTRVSPYVRYGALPASLMGMVWLVASFSCLSQSIYDRYRGSLDRGGEAGNNSDEQGNEATRQR
ncbi:apolipoprotein N-acyltransferase [Allorhodopirellula heiligendammensis]|uniref:Apolipoprotein N-acyltransferase n=1 Tax=Allorhodopirellula heiligendammensis TaxID=2714739 RepID=A0A5C6C4B0_9BACT|nr:apolipoprotein N-acyltransferase [Allorhodopirellula heiligendammensis]TWU18817.1 Apolipoprotein N-acyltransferase [Allorhodopirellula heiligendammensis]